MAHVDKIEGSTANMAARRTVEERQAAGIAAIRRTDSGWQVERLVGRLNALDVDAVVVAGDWTYEPPRDLHALRAQDPALDAFCEDVSARAAALSEDRAEAGRLRPRGGEPRRSGGERGPRNVDRNPLVARTRGGREPRRARA